MISVDGRVEEMAKEETDDIAESRVLRERERERHLSTQVAPPTKHD